MSNNFQSRQIGLSFFKVIMGFLIIQNMFRYLNYSDLLFGIDGIAPFERYTALLDMYGLSFLEQTFQILSPGTYLWIVAILALLYAIGIGKWFVGMLLYVAILNLHLRNHLILDGSDSVILVSLPFVILADRGSSLLYNWPNFKMENTALLQHIRKLATLGFIVQVCIIYLATGLVKAKFDIWNQGIANYYILQLHEYEATKWNILLANNPIFVKMSTYSTLVFEILFPLAILFKYSKYLWLLLGVFFHVGIWIFMKIDVFPWIMIGTYFVFISDDEYRRWAKHIRGYLTTTFNRQPIPAKTGPQE